VFDITTEISKQVFPLTLNTDDPRFRRGLERMRVLSLRAEALRERGGLLNTLRRGVIAVQSALTFGRLYLLPTQSNELPSSIRMAPAW